MPSSGRGGPGKGPGLEEGRRACDPFGEAGRDETEADRGSLKRPRRSDTRSGPDRRVPEERREGMAIVRWLDPFRDLTGIQDRMNQIFEDALSRSRGRDEGMRTGRGTPAVDIYEENDFVVVKAELPGGEKDQMSVEVRDGVRAL